MGRRPTLHQPDRADAPASGGATRSQVVFSRRGFSRTRAAGYADSWADTESAYGRLEMDKEAKPEGCLVVLSGIMIVFGGIFTAVALFGDSDYSQFSLWAILIFVGGFVLYFMGRHRDTRCPKCHRSDALRITKTWKTDEWEQRAGAYAKRYGWTDHTLITCRYCNYNRTETSEQVRDPD